MSLWLASLLVASVQAGCELDPDRAGDGALYYACDESAPTCASGFSCWPGVAGVHGDEGWSSTGLCLSTAALGDAEPGAKPCPELLEDRVLDPDTAGSSTCMFPFQCAAESGGELLPGDATRCPLGFVCIPGDGSECAACGFASCDMTAYQAPSATLTGLTNAFDACAVRNSGDASPFAGEAAGRVYCRLSPSSQKYTGCPAGWSAADTLPEGCPGSEGSFCFLVASVGDTAHESWSADAVHTGADTRTNPVAPLMLAPVGSTQSCRPAP